MPEYTSLGIQYPVPTDEIKRAELEAKLAEDIKQTAMTANQAILTEGARAESAAKAEIVPTVSHELTERDVLTGDDPRSPRQTASVSYTHAFTDAAGKVALGIRADGTVEIGGAPTGGPTRKTAVALTHASGSNQKDTRTAVQARIPFKLGVTARVRILHLRNYEDRTGLAYPGALSFTGVYWGEAARDISGQLNGQFADTPTRLSDAFTTNATGADTALPVDMEIKAGVDYLLSYGYTSAAQDNHLGVGGSWTNATPANAGIATDTLTLGKFAPLDVWLEVETTAPIVAYIGDSLSCGVSSEIPGYQSVPMIHGRANGYLPLMYTHSGSAMTSWTNPNVNKYQKWAHLDKPDALVFSLSKNDFGSTTDMAVLRTRFQQVYSVITAATTKNMYLTTCLPSRNEADAIGTAERAWNEILLNEQLGNAVNVFDIRKALTAPSGGLDPAYDSGDGVHLNKRGYAAVAAAITHPLVGK